MLTILFYIRRFISICAKSIRYLLLTRIFINFINFILNYMFLEIRLLGLAENVLNPFLIYKQGRTFKKSITHNMS